jgi:uncharacterized protein
MPIVLNQIKLPIEENESSLSLYAARALAVPAKAITGLRVVRISLDARKKDAIAFNYTLEVSLSPQDEAKLVKKGFVQAKQIEFDEPIFGSTRLDKPIIVVGLGPAGLFAAYTLAKYGYKPIVIERGKNVENRQKDVETFWQTGKLNTESNVMFGEGGAGTFSDGKLTTRIKDPRAHKVVELLHHFGAPEEITVMAKPHIGTDRLIETVKNIRQEIVSLGGEVRFESKLSGIESKDEHISAAIVQTAAGEERIECSALILAAGQGGKDTYEMLLNAGVEIVPKPFAAGVRIEHPRQLIDSAQYGRHMDNPRLGAAEYQLTSQQGGRGVYTFCMCPGGVVVASSSAKEQVVVNGMSYYARNGENSNAAVVVQVGEKDYPAGPLGGLEFREKLEYAAFIAGGADYRAPACTVGSMNGRKTAFASVRPTYRPGVKEADLRKVLPDYMYEGIRLGLKDFGRRLKGYDMAEAVITAVESRTSSPVRILRTETGEATRVAGLYPVGEGAGYAGGIVSAAVDGMKAAEHIMAIYKRA